MPHVCVCMYICVCHITLLLSHQIQPSLCQGTAVMANSDLSMGVTSTEAESKSASTMPGALFAMMVLTALKPKSFASISALTVKVMPSIDDYVCSTTKTIVP